jgi:hypothetical protein
LQPGPPSREATTVKAIFGDAIDPASVTASTFVLRDQHQRGGAGDHSLALSGFR